MELTALFVALAGAGSLVVGVLSNRKHLRRWNQIVSGLGLKIVGQSGHPWGIWLEARDAKLTVRIEGPRRKGEHGTALIVTVPGRPGIRGLRIRRETFFELKSGELEIGDNVFDRRFSIKGSETFVASLLDAEVRMLLGLLDDASRQFEIDGQQIKVRVPDQDVTNVLPLLLDVGRRFAQMADTAPRLASNALQDPQAAVRLLNLRLLVREFPKEELTRDTSRQACVDQSPEVRLHAATNLGDEGRGVLLTLAERLEDDACSAQAVRNLGEALPFEGRRDLLLAALRWRRTRTALVCLESLGRSGEAAAMDVLVRALGRETGELATAAAKALGETGLGEAEAPLVQALRREEAEVRSAAIEALGRMGSVTAVLPLREAEESSLLDREQRRAARQAVAEIQARLAGASPGQLSLAGDEAGQLSLAEAEAGQLSLAVDQAGELSLPVDPARQLSLPESEKPQRP